LIGNFDAAVADCTKVINDVPDFPNAYMVRGDAYGMKRMYHKAIVDFKIGLEKGYDVSNYSVDKSYAERMWYCGALYMEIVVNRYLGNSTVVTKYENWLKTVCDNSNITRLEVETFYRNNIRGLISDAVDEEFGKITFPVAKANAAPGALYYATLIRTGNNQFVLEYSNILVKEDRGRIPDTPVPLDTLLTMMRRDTTKFDQNWINTVQNQATSIPAVARSGEMERTKATITNFFLTPNNGNYNALYGLYHEYDTLFKNNVTNPFVSVLSNLNHNLVMRITR
jgi:hypothetical protein